MDRTAGEVKTMLVNGLMRLPVVLWRPAGWLFHNVWRGFRHA